jgi:hypothetical protein
MEKIKSYDSCRCGAVTLNFENGETNSIQKKNLSKFNLSLKGVKKINTFSSCNHCVNHYGLDICECGSGLTPEKCCKKSTREQYGRSVEAGFKTSFGTLKFKKVSELC